MDGDLSSFSFFPRGTWYVHPILETERRYGPYIEYEKRASQPIFAACSSSTAATANDSVVCERWLTGGTATRGGITYQDDEDCDKYDRCTIGQLCALCFHFIPDGYATTSILWYLRWDS
jgi:hypothetical protein